MMGKVPDSGTTERALGVGALLTAGATGQLPLTLGAGAALAGYGTQPVQNYLMGRLGQGAAQQAILDALRSGTPYGAALGASQFAD